MSYLLSRSRLVDFAESGTPPTISSTDSKSERMRHLKRFVSAIEEDEQGPFTVKCTMIKYLICEAFRARRLESSLEINTLLRSY